MMGSPMVFHTAPPQPASKARITWYAVFAGGSEASQKGFGERTPQKSILRSGMGTPSLRRFQRLVNAGCRFFAVGYGIHHFAASVYAVAAREVFRIGSTHGLRVN